MALQPPELPRPRERGLQFKMSRCAEIERAPRVMFTASRHRAYAEDLFDALAAREFAADDGRLARHAAKR